MPHICCYPNPLLKERSVEVLSTEKYSEWIDSMRSIWNHLDNPLGLAAVQIGIGKRICLVKDSTGTLVMINPVIVEQKNPMSAREYCYSLPGISNIVEAYNDITVEYHDEKFELITGVFTELEARIVQHEINHMNGLTIMDVGSFTPINFANKLKRLSRQHKGLLYV